MIRGTTVTDGQPTPSGQHIPAPITGQHHGSPVTNHPVESAFGGSQKNQAPDTQLPQRASANIPRKELPATEYQELAEALDLQLFVFGEMKWINWPEVLQQVVPDGSGHTFGQRFHINPAKLSNIQEQLEQTTGSQPLYWLLVVLEQSLTRKSSDLRQETPGHRYLLSYLKSLSAISNIGGEVSTLVQSFPETPFLSENLARIATQHKLNSTHYGALMTAIEKSLTSLKFTRPDDFKHLIPMLRGQKLWTDADQAYLTANPDSPHDLKRWNKQFMDILKTKGPAASLHLVKTLLDTGMGKSCYCIMTNVNPTHSETLMRAINTNEDELDGYGSQRKETEEEMICLDSWYNEAWQKKSQHENLLRKFCFDLPRNKDLTLEDRQRFLEWAKKLIETSELQGAELAKQRKTKKFWNNIDKHPLKDTIDNLSWERETSFKELKKELTATCTANRQARLSARKPQVSEKDPNPSTEVEVKGKTEKQIRDEVKKELQEEKEKNQGRIIQYLRAELAKARSEAAGYADAQQRALTLELEIMELKDAYNKALQKFIKDKSVIVKSLAEQYLNRVGQLKTEHSEKLRQARMQPGIAQFPCNICYEHQPEEQMKIFKCCAYWFCTTCIDELKKMAHRYEQPFSCPLCRSELTQKDILPVRAGNVTFVSDVPVHQETTV